MPAQLLPVASWSVQAPIRACPASIRRASSLLRCRPRGVAAVPQGGPCVCDFWFTMAMTSDCCRRYRGVLGEKRTRRDRNCVRGGVKTTTLSWFLWKTVGREWKGGEAEVLVSSHRCRGGVAAGGTPPELRSCTYAIAGSKMVQPHARRHNPTERGQCSKEPYYYSNTVPASLEHSVSGHWLVDISRLLVFLEWFCSFFAVVS